MAETLHPLVQASATGQADSFPRDSSGKIILDSVESVRRYIRENGGEINKEKDGRNIQVLNLRNCHFTFKILLDQWTKPGHSNYVGLPDYIIFSGSVFDRFVYIGKRKEKYEFIAARFKQEVSIAGVTFTNKCPFCKAIFENKVNVFNCKLKSLHIFDDATFQGEVFFKSAEITGTGNYEFSKNPLVFKGKVEFQETTFCNADFSGFTFEEDVLLTETTFNCKAYFNRVIFQKKLTFSSVHFLNNVYFEEAHINDLSLEYIAFPNIVSLNECNISRLSIRSIYFEKPAFNISHLEVQQCDNRYTARFMKNEALKANDMVLALKFKAIEMQEYWKELKRIVFRKHQWQHLPECILLGLNTVSNNNGRWWLLGAAFTVIVWVIFFSLFIIVRDGWGSTFIWADPAYLKEAVSYFWVFSGLDGLMSKNVTLIGISIFILGKIFIAYGIFQTISAFRKYSK